MDSFDYVTKFLLLLLTLLLGFVFLPERVGAGEIECLLGILTGGTFVYCSFEDEHDRNM